MSKRLKKFFNAEWASPSSPNPPETQARHPSNAASQPSRPDRTPSSSAKQTSSANADARSFDSTSRSTSAEIAGVPLTPASSSNSSQESVPTSSSRTRKFSTRFDASWTSPAPNTKDPQEQDDKDRLEEVPESPRPNDNAIEASEVYDLLQELPGSFSNSAEYSTGLPYELATDSTAHEPSQSYYHIRAAESFTPGSLASSTATPSYGYQAGEAAVHPPTGYGTASPPVSLPSGTANESGMHRPQGHPHERMLYTDTPLFTVEIDTEPSVRSARRQAAALAAKQTRLSDKSRRARKSLLDAIGFRGRTCPGMA